jgi:hypothetical protein
MNKATIKLTRDVGEEMSAALRFVESGDFLAAAARCDQAASVCLALGGYKFGGVDKLARARKDADDNHAACCAAKDELAEIADIVADVKPDRDSEASGTLVERVRALIELAGL